MNASNELHTFSVCEKCGESIRASHHSDTDCETIRRLKAEIKTARNAALDIGEFDCLERQSDFVNIGKFSDIIKEWHQLKYGC